MMSKTLIRLVPRLLRKDQQGITGLETAIVLIAFVVVASVFAFAVLSTGLLSSEKSKETTLAGISETASSISLRGSVIARKAAGATVESLVFELTNASQAGEAVSLSETGNSRAIITYIDDDQAVDIPVSLWQATWKIGTGATLNPGERTELRVTLTGLSTLLGASTRFSVQVKPIVGALLEIQRSTPAELTTIMNLD